MEITIRESTINDFPEIFSMIQELAKFEKAPEKVSNSVEQMIEEKAHFNSLVAETENGEIAGFTLFYFVYYTWVGKSLYLDDLYVKEAFRGNGIGKKFLKEIFKFAKKENCKRLRWQVLDWNTPAIDMYRDLGASLDNEWINCDFNLIDG